jgi:hypothetical protein
LAEAVREELEENLLLLAQQLPSLPAEQLVDDYRRLIKLAAPELIPRPEESLLRQSRHLIRHLADVPVLLSAMASKPDWLLTHNTKHFTETVARRSGLRIGTPKEFFQTLSAVFGY